MNYDLPVQFDDKFIIPKGTVYIIREPNWQALLGVKRGDTIMIDGRRQCIVDIEMMRSDPAGCTPTYGLLMENEPDMPIVPLEDGVFSSKIGVSMVM